MCVYICISVIQRYRVYGVYGVNRYMCTCVTISEMQRYKVYRVYSVNRYVYARVCVYFRI